MRHGRVGAGDGDARDGHPGTDEDDADADADALDWQYDAWLDAVTDGELEQARDMLLAAAAAAAVPPDAGDQPLLPSHAMWRLLPTAALLRPEYLGAAVQALGAAAGGNRSTRQACSKSVR